MLFAFKMSCTSDCLQGNAKTTNSDIRHVDFWDHPKEFNWLMKSGNSNTNPDYSRSPTPPECSIQDSEVDEILLVQDDYIFAPGVSPYLQDLSPYVHLQTKDGHTNARSGLFSPLRASQNVFANYIKLEVVDMKRFDMKSMLMLAVPACSY